MTVPATDDADIYVCVIAECYGKILAEAGREITAAAIAERLSMWCDRWAPELAAAEIERISKIALRMQGRLPDSETVGRRLRLTYQDRCRLKITAIGCYDIDKKARKARARERKRERDRIRAAAKRAARVGHQSREEYLSRSKSKLKPWEAQGVSRRTYYRRLSSSRRLTRHKSVASPSYDGWSD